MSHAFLTVCKQGIPPEKSRTFGEGKLVAWVGLLQGSQKTMGKHKGEQDSQIWSHMWASISENPVPLYCIAIRIMIKLYSCRNNFNPLCKKYRYYHECLIISMSSGNQPSTNAHSS